MDDSFDSGFVPLPLLPDTPAPLPPDPALSPQLAAAAARHGAPAANRGR